MEAPGLPPPTPDNAIVWHAGALYLLDQRGLPARTEFVVCNEVAEVAGAIAAMVVRGAPAIGVTAAYGVVLAARRRYADDGEGWRRTVVPDLDRLAGSRPTAVNLFWALGRMRGRFDACGDGDPVPMLLSEAAAIHREDRDANRRMGELGAALIEGPTSVITHCNAGSLATGGYGTALGVIRSAYAEGRLRRVYADETRPWLQGSRLTAWELMQDGIPVVIQVDGAAASLMPTGEIGWVIVGADRVAANGDVANKIGTYALAVLARHHGVRFMVVAPTSTIDPGIPDGQAIPIEERGAMEVLTLAGNVLAPPGAAVRNPVFDVTPADLVDVLVTERGVIRRPDSEKIRALLRG